MARPSEQFDITLPVPDIKLPISGPAFQRPPLPRDEYRRGPLPGSPGGCRDRRGKISERLRQQDSDLYLAACNLLAARHGRNWRRIVGPAGLAGAALEARFYQQINKFFGG